MISLIIYIIYWITVYGLTVYISKKIWERMRDNFKKVELGFFEVIMCFFPIANVLVALIIYFIEFLCSEKCKPFDEISNKFFKK